MPLAAVASKKEILPDKEGFLFCEDAALDPAGLRPALTKGAHPFGIPMWKRENDIIPTLGFKGRVPWRGLGAEPQAEYEAAPQHGKTSEKTMRLMAYCSFLPRGRNVLFS